MKWLTLLISAVLLVGSISVLQANTIHVPADSSTIQAGINGAVDGDTVLVADGTYTGDGNRDIDFLGKAIVVMSENGYETTIIDCENNGRGFYFHSGEGRSSILHGFTIKNGNVGGGYGGAIFCNDTSPSILQCLFFSNEADVGGGIGCVHQSMPLIEGCIFTSNHGSSYGGGIDCSHGSNADIVGCEFYSNTAISGGAIRSAEADAIISDCIIEYNTVTGNGGGINNHTNASASISNCIIRNNASGQKGGGIYVGGSSSFPQITGCLITHNASELGGGIQCNGNVDATILNCTIVQNQAPGGIGGAITFYNNGHADVSNSILWNNVPGEIEIIEGSIDITYSDIDGSWPGTGNIDDDPLFVDPDNDNYHLLWGSPCIDSGDPSSPPDPDSTRADMGAYYFHQGGRIIHVPEDYPTIQDGIDAALLSDTVLVADGIYGGVGNRDIDFIGKAIVVMSESGPESCIIDCQADSLDPHRGFYFNTGEDLTSVVQGFTIQNGYAYGDWPQNCGGAILCDGSSPTITGNMIIGNTAYRRGGGICLWIDSSPTIIGNTITGNTTIVNGGGGILCWRQCSPTITNNVISGNTSNTAAGGISCGRDSSFPTITNNVISGNTAHGAGGGIHCTSRSFPTITGNIISGNHSLGDYSAYGGGIYSHASSSTITDNTISGNYANWSGGGIYCNSSSSTIKGNTVTGNTTKDDGGGIYIRWENTSTIDNNTITGNTAENDGGGFFCADVVSFVTIMNSILWGNSPDEIYRHSGTLIVNYSDIQGGWEGEGNIDEDPLFVWHDASGRIDSRLLWDSPCIDTGHPDSLDADSTRSDMGAHYFNQNDYLTLYMTPDTTEVAQGGQMGVTYTVINRWQQKEPFSALTRVTLPDGEVRTVLGPEDYEICPGYTFQTHLTYDIPQCAYLGMYEYRSLIGMPPGTLYDEDSFIFKVVE